MLAVQAAAGWGSRVTAQGPRRPEFDVALSFAGEQRPYVEAVAADLRRRGISYFYDAEQEAALWGNDLGETLVRVYEEAAAIVVMFVSAEYARKDWTRVERRAALSRAVSERREYVLPARFDATGLPGLPRSTAYVDLTRKKPEELASLIAAKLERLFAPPAWLRVIDPTSSIAEPTGVVHYAGELFVADHATGEVIRLRPDGQVTGRIGGFRHPHHLYRVDESVVVCDTGHDRLVALDRDLREQWTRRRLGNVPLRAPHGLASTEAASFLALSTGNNALVSVVGGRVEAVLQTPGGTGGSGPGEFRSPCGVAATEAHVLVADTFNHRVQVLNRRLEHLGSFGTPGQGDAEMAYPVGVLAWRRGHVLVADERNQRMQLWRLKQTSPSLHVECLQVLPVGTGGRQTRRVAAGCAPAALGPVHMRQEGPQNDPWGLAVPATPDHVGVLMTVRFPSN